MSFSETIRRYRKERGWTLETLSKRVDLSVAQLSKLETGKSKPSIDSLRRLASVYGVAVSMLADADGCAPLSPMRKGDGFIVFAGDGGDVILRFLTMRRSAKIQPVEVVIPAGSAFTPKQAAAAGEVFVYVVSGKVDCCYGESENCEMDAGDSLYFDGFVPYSWKNEGETEAVLILCGDVPSV